MVDIAWDLTKGLPFLSSNQFDAIISEHFFEHIPRRAASDLIRECFRSLRGGGTIRIAMPCLDGLIEKYRGGAHFTDQAQDTGEFGAANGPLHCTRGEWLNVAMRSWNHTYIYNFEDLAVLLGNIGFSDVRRETHGHSGIGMLVGRETRPPEESDLIAEATKPG